MSTTHCGAHPLLEGDTAFLVVIDVQERLLPVIAEKERLIDNILRLIKFSRIMGIPVLLTEQENLGDTAGELRDALSDVPPVTKLAFNCFGSRRFRERVEALGRRSMIVAGIETHICVAQTALHAVPEFRVHCVADAVSSRSAHNTDIALDRMRCEGVTVTSTEMLMYELLERAGTDRFRAALRLVT